MHVLTATSRHQTAEGDFCWTVEGELVRLSEPCDRDEVVRETGEGTGCGCSRAFSGLGSLRSTTTAMVRDLPLTRDDVVLALQSGLQQAGWLPEALDDEDRADLEAEADDLLALVAVHDPGTVLERDFDDVRPR